MLRCWKTWIDNFIQTRFALIAFANLVFVFLICTCALSQQSFAQQSVLQSYSPEPPALTEQSSNSGNSSARIISGMIQFESATPMRQSSNPNLPLAERSQVNSVPTLTPRMADQSYGLRTQPNQSRISQTGYQASGQAIGGVALGGGAIGHAPRYAPDARTRSIPRYLVPPGSGTSPGNTYQPNRMALRQDEDPFGEPQPQRPRGNNRNPFGNKPQEGRIDPFADPPQNNIVPPGSIPPAPRRDPFDDPPEQIPDGGVAPRDTIPRQEDYQDPRLPGEIPDFGPFDQELPIPESQRNGGFDNGGRQPNNEFPTSGRPIRRAPTTHYGPSRRGQFQEGFGDGYQSDYFANGYQNNYQNGYDNYREPQSFAQPAYAPPQYGGIVDEVGLDGYCSNCLQQPYSCCEPLFYISIFGGYSDSELDGLAFERGVAAPTTGQYELDDGYGFGIAIGQTQGANLRTELEYSFRSNDGSAFELSNLPDLDLSGDVSSMSGMFNFAWDFNNIQLTPRIRPYVGGGVGFSFIDVDLEFDTNTPLQSDDFDSDSAFAWQLFTGITYQYSTSMNFYVEYRYFDASGLALESQSDANTTLFGDLDYQVNNLFAGFRLRF